MNESLAQEPSAAHRGALVQKRGLARNIQGGLFPAERAEVAFIIDFPPPHRSEVASGCWTGHLACSGHPSGGRPEALEQDPEKPDGVSGRTPAEAAY